MDELREITQHLLRFSPDALIVIDASGQIRFANETVTELFGYTPDALLGKPIDVLVPARFHGRHGHHVSSYSRAPKNREMGARITDLFALRADGTEFAAGIRLAPFTLGGKLFTAAAIRDTTERQIVNEELVIARTEADRANRAKSRFLATASHDLRQPMQTIRLLNAALLRAIPQPEMRELLVQQGSAIEGMAKLLDALLDISRLESGSIQPQLTDVRLADIFAELRSEFASVARARSVALFVGDSAATISTDRTLFSQLLRNLIGNALKYTDSGSVVLSCYSEDRGLVVTVQDTGIGIPADKLERIFDEYYQVDTHGAKRVGVGLGLAIVKEVARLLEVSVSIRSTVGQGTTVFIKIPERRVTLGTVDKAAVPPPASRVPAGKSRLFLVEDNDGVRLATETFLKLEGYDLQSAPTVAAAELMFARLQPDDIVIADYHLDGRNTGLDMLMRLRERTGRQVPGIILSGDLPSVLRSIKSPVPNCRFLGKPVDINELMQTIAQLSGTAELQEGAAAMVGASKELNG